MDKERYLDQQKEIQSLILNCIDDETNEKSQFEEIIKFIDEHKLEENKMELKIFLHLLSNISANHYRYRNFSTKIQQILIHLQNPIKNFFSNLDIFYLFKKDKNILLFLLQQQIITPDNYILNQIIENNQSKLYSHFFYPEIKSLLDDKKCQQIENEILNQNSEYFNNIEQNRQKGENISPICFLIHSDSVEEFIAYVNRTNIPLSSEIELSPFETNSFLLKKKSTIIEYAAFFGSYQIFQYLLMNKVTPDPSIWLYAIHGNNAEMIHLLEYNKIQLPDSTFCELVKEAIKCHHNNIANYFIDNFLDDSLKSTVFQYAIQYHNYEFFESDFSHHFVLNFFCKYDHFPLFESLLPSISNFDLSLLSVAAKKHNREIIQLLISYHQMKFDSSLLKETENLTHLTMLSNLETVKRSLTEIAISSSVKLLESSTFEGFSVLEKVTIPSSVEEIGDKCFCDCPSLSVITIPSSVRVIGEKAFETCSSLTNVVFLSPSSLEIIQKGTFSRCSSLTEINIPSSVTEIGLEAFYCCSSLEHLTIPSSVQVIDDNAFEECVSLTDVKVPSSLTKIGDNAFYGCSSLAEIDFECPSLLTEIGSNVFDSCSSLEYISIPPSLTLIGDSVFSNCSSLKEISVPFDLDTYSIGLNDDVNIKRLECTFI